MTDCKMVALPGIEPGEMVKGYEMSTMSIEYVREVVKRGGAFAVAYHHDSDRRELLLVPYDFIANPGIASTPWSIAEFTGDWKNGNAEEIVSFLNDYFFGLLGAAEREARTEGIQASLPKPPQM